MFQPSLKLVLTIPGYFNFSDEHSLIAQYCQNLHNGDVTSIVPDSPLQIMNELDSKHRQELELRVRLVFVYFHFTSRDPFHNTQTATFWHLNIIFVVLNVTFLAF